MQPTDTVKAVCVRHPNSETLFEAELEFCVFYP
jgi:hypothetical protein